MLTMLGKGVTQATILLYMITSHINCTTLDVINQGITDLSQVSIPSDTTEGKFGFNSIQRIQTGVFTGKGMHTIFYG